MNRLIPMFALTALALVGCTSYHTERGAQSRVEPAALAGPEYNTEWTTGEERVTGEGTARVLFWVFNTGDGKYAEVPGFNIALLPTATAIQDAKAAATYDACEKHGADAILGAVYHYTVTSGLFWKTVECQIEGYPANITGVKLLDSKPVLIDKDAQVVRIKPSEQIIDMTSKSAE